ncbi:MAG: SHOCT domain-containing protein [Anaerolineae bacterium]|jgi:uncharacterized membrane protein
MIGLSLLVLVVLGGLVLALIGGGSRLLTSRHDIPAAGPGSYATPRQILDERLARGEIDRDEYEAIRAQLES